MPPPPVREATLSQRTALGVLWFLLQNVGSRVTAFASQLVLAWLLSPADFGLIGLALVVSNLVNTLVNFGVDDVLIQRAARVRHWAGSAIWIGLALGLAGGAVVALSSPLVALLYRKPQLVGLLLTLAVSLPIGTLSTVPSVMLRSQMRFQFLAAYGAGELILQQVLTIVLAYLGFGAFSFVIPVPLMAALRVAVYWSVVKRPRRLRVNRAQSRHLLKNGAAVFGSKLIVAAIGQGDYAVLGLFAPSAVVGAYFFAFRLAAQPVYVLAGNFNAVIYPVLAGLAGDPARQRAAAVRSSRLLAHMIFPLSFIQAAVAGPLLGAAFGERWQAAVPLIQLLSLGLAFDAVPWIAGSYLSALGGFKRNLAYSALSLPVFFGLVVAGATFGSAPGVALAVAAYYVVYGPAYTWAIFRRTGAAAKEVVDIFGRAAVLSCLATAVGLLAGRLAAQLSPNGFWLAAVIGAATGLAYLALLPVVSRDIWNEAVGQALALLRHWGVGRRAQVMETAA